GRRRPARAGVRELRHVHRLCGARSGLLRRGGGTPVIAKFAVVLYLARSLVKKGDRVGTFQYGIVPHYLVVGLIAGLVLLEPDFGTATLCAGLLVLMLFAGGVPVRMLGLPALGAIPALLLLAWKSPYRWMR